MESPKRKHLIQKKLLFCVCFTVLLVLVCAKQPTLACQSKDSKTARSDAPRPNIILINLDDADVDLFSDKILDDYLPNIKQLAKSGLSFTNFHVTTPLCGPSRACLMRGQHAHRTGIKTNVESGALNNGYSGSYTLFKKLGYEKENLGVWMHRAGYRTMMIGKYSHGRMNPVGIPGWDDLFICFGGNYYSTARYSTRLPEKLRRGPTRADEYRTVVEAKEAVGMIEEHAQRIRANQDAGAKDAGAKDAGAKDASANQNAKSSRRRRVTSTPAAQPFFLYMAPLAPHLPAGKTEMIEEQYKDFAKGLRLESTPDLNESDMSDKPKHLQLAKFKNVEVATMHEEHRKRLATIKSIDDLLAKLMDSLKANGFDKNTYIFFTSDHGYQLGHNRMIAKKMPFHRSTVVPMFVVGPGIKAGATDHLMAHIDLVPTFLELAGGKAPIDFDGKSLVPLLKDPESIPLDDFRSELLIQNWEEKGQVGTYVFATYASMRTSKQIYVEWANGEREFYDLEKDPYQLENKINSLGPKQLADLSRRLHDLKRGTPEPVATIANAELISKNSVIRGFAEDDNAVAAVQVEFRNPANDDYWNGKTWQSEKTSVTAKLGYPKGLISTWEAAVDLTGFENESRLDVSAVAMDDQGTVSKRAQFQCRVDAIDPTTSLRIPVADSTVTSPVTLAGNCDDNQKMRGVELVLENTADGTFWNGRKWTAEKSTFFKRVLLKRWHRKVELKPGRYRLTARSQDMAGNYDATPEVVDFSVKEK